MSKKSLSAITAIALFGFFGCSNEPKEMKSEHHIEEIHAIHHHIDHEWGYTGKESPRYWGELDEKYKMCGIGKSQSPIDIVPTKDIELPELKFSYTSNSHSVINNGHTVQVNIDSGSFVEIDGKKFYLKQFHFHTPSENKINGKQFDLEAHFVHVADDGQIAVVGVMFNEGAENPIIKKIWDKFPLKEGQKIAISLSPTEITELFPRDRDYYKFIGSLTTPPCSENVKWQVFKTPLTISKEQKEKFFNLLGFENNRPTQPLNGREVFE